MYRKTYDYGNGNNVFRMYMKRLVFKYEIFATKYGNIYFVAEFMAHFILGMKYEKSHVNPVVERKCGENRYGKIFFDIFIIYGK